MKVITKVMSMFRKHAGEFEVWDTSAISTWFEKLVQSVNTEWIHVIIPEGVYHELSVGRHSYENCREAYRFIDEANKEGKLTIYVTKNNMRSWTVDEQVVAIACEYYKKGYNTSLVTCDRNQSDNAQNMGINVERLRGNRSFKTSKNVTYKSEPEKVKPKVESENNQNELKIPCITKNKVTYINVKPGIAVYDNRGKRKIGKENLIAVSYNDVVVYKEYKYMIKAYADTYITLRKMDDL